MTEDRSVTKAREEIFDALRFLAPDEAHRLLKGMTENMAKVSERYDALLLDAICR